MSTSEDRKLKILESGRSALKIEADALTNAAETLSDEFINATNLLYAIKGKVVLTGLGKSGHIAKKIAATLSSTGTTAIFLHPSEALHGDLGVIDKNDAIVAVAQGGETDEVVAVVNYAKRIGLPIIAITGRKDSRLDQLAACTISSAINREACPLNLAPTASSTVAMGIGDALAVALMELKGFEVANFAEIHPGGYLGRKLRRIDEFIIDDDRFVSVNLDSSIAEVARCLSTATLGMIAVLNEQGQTVGVVTDGDVRRAIVNYSDRVHKVSAEQIMTRSPKSISKGCLAIEAINMMDQHKITTLLVESTNKKQKILGIIRLHDLLEAKIY